MFDEGRALDVFLLTKSFIFSPPQRHFNMSPMNTKDGVGGDRPALASRRRVIAPPLDSAVCFPEPGDDGADGEDL